MITEEKMKKERWTFEKAKETITRIIPNFDTSKLKNSEIPSCDPEEIHPAFQYIAQKGVEAIYWGIFIEGFYTASEYFLKNEKLRKSLELSEDTKENIDTITMLCENLEEAIQAVKVLSEELEDLKGLHRGDLYPLTFSLETVES